MCDRDGQSNKNNSDTQTEEHKANREVNGKEERKQQRRSDSDVSNDLIIHTRDYSMLQHRTP